MIVPAVGGRAEEVRVEEIARDESRRGTGLVEGRWKPRARMICEEVRRRGGQGACKGEASGPREIRVVLQRSQEGVRRGGKVCRASGEMAYIQPRRVGIQQGRELSEEAVGK